MKRAILAVTLIWGTAAYAAPPAKVLVLPFDGAGPDDKAWIAKAVQQNLVAELSRVNSVQPTTGASAIQDPDGALKAAQDAGADFVVSGTYQIVENDLRLTGQVTDVARKQAVAGLKATGTLRDLFGLEDVIAHQVKRALPQPVPAEPKAELLQQPKPQPPVLEPDGPIVMDPNARLRAVEKELDRAIDRLKYAPGYEYERPIYYGRGYPYSYGGYYGYGYPIYYYFPIKGHCGPRIPSGSGASFSASALGGNYARAYGVGRSSNRAFMANYANFGRMSAVPIGRR